MVRSAGDQWLHRHGRHHQRDPVRVSPAPRLTEPNSVHTWKVTNPGRLGSAGLVLVAQFRHLWTENEGGFKGNIISRPAPKISFDRFGEGRAHSEGF